ncbi:MAG: hypothetical protein HKN24_00495 [Acidimicrobiales bacterium]|nr:hypothetical protein [Acidimicrobiales bacterium]
MTAVAHLLETSEVHARWCIDVRHTLAESAPETLAVVVDLVLSRLNGHIPSEEVLGWAAVNPDRK